LATLPSAGVRVGIHVGDIHLRGGDISGAAIVIAARISRLAGPGEVLMSNTAVTAAADPSSANKQRRAPTTTTRRKVWVALQTDHGRNALGGGQMAKTAAVRHPWFSRFYARFAANADRKGATEHRRELLAGLAGRVIEVGAGTGVNFAHYPPTVTQVVAVEPEPFLRSLAEQAAARAPVPVVVIDGVAERLPPHDASFDAGVASLVLCSVASQERALAELLRVIRPGGELRFYEHVISDERRFAAVQKAIDSVWPYFAGGCHASRDTVGMVERAGFDVAECRRFRFVPSFLGFPVSPHVIGVARRPTELRVESDASFEELGQGVCLRLLATQSIGRLAISTGMHPVIFPVNYILDGDTIVFRSDAGSQCDAISGQPVAFEVDSVDADRRVGWSVHVWGRASEIGRAHSRELQARIHALALVPWAPGDKDHWIRVVPAGMTGRRIRRRGEAGHFSTQNRRESPTTER
jgi:SAM-dependent methyltransferase